MDAGLTVSIASFAVSALALIISAMLSMRAVRMARTANSIQVVAEIFREARTREFREHVRAVANAKWPDELADGVDALDPATWESVYRLCAFFEHLGVLVEYGLVDEKIVLASMDYTLSSVWIALQPVITAERQRRIRTYPRDSDPTFLPHFENLMRLTKGRWMPRKRSDVGDRVSGQAV